MTDNTLKEALKEAYASAPSKDVIIDTLEFKTFSSKTTPPHTLIARIIRGTQVDVIHSQSDYVQSAGYQNQVPLTIENNSTQMFFPLNFDMNLAPTSSEPNPEMSITLDNIGTIFFDALDQAIAERKRILVTYRPYLSSRLEDGPQALPPPTLNVTSVTANLSYINIRARMFDIADRTFPSQIYETKNFPGLLG